MKISVVYRDFDSNVGDAYDVRSIVLQLLELGHDVSVYCSENSNNELQHSNLRYRRSKNVVSTCVKLYTDRASLGVVHLFCGFIPSLAPISWICRLFHIPYAYSPFGQILPNAFTKSRLKKLAYSRFFLRDLIRNAKFIHVISEYEKKQLLKYGAKQVVVSPLAIQGYEVNINKSTKANYVTFIGRLDIWHKGLDMLVPAVTKCKDILKANNLRVVLAGRGSLSNIEKLHRLISSNNAKGIIDVRHDISEDEKYTLLANTKIFIHPSRVEGFARSMREAISLRIPIVTTYDSNVGDYINQYEIGSASALDADDLAAALAMVVESDFSSKRELYERLISELTWSKLAEALCSGYRY